MTDRDYERLSAALAEAEALRAQVAELQADKARQAETIAIYSKEVERLRRFITEQRQAAAKQAVALAHLEARNRRVGALVDNLSGKELGKPALASQEDDDLPDPSRMN